MKSQKVFLVSTIGFVVTNFRKEFLKDLLQRGYEVKVLCSSKGDFDNTLLNDFSELWINIPFSRGGMNPIVDCKTLLTLFRVFQKEKPDIVINYGIKPSLYSSIAAGLANVSRVYSNITGLGYTFIGKGFRRGVIKNIAIFLYRIAFIFNRKVFFQNPDDRKEFVSKKILSLEKTVLINGSGVNLQLFYPKFKTIDSDGLPKLLFVGRILKDKGIIELVEAFLRLKEEFPKVELTIVGGCDFSNPACVPLKTLEKWKQQPGVCYIPHSQNILPIYQGHDILVLPSYREGTPKVVLEAMACGLPILTTDAPGCRETVINGKNGFLVEVANSDAIYRKLKTLLSDSSLRKSMGDESLSIAQKKYDVNKVNEQIFKVITSRE